LKPTEEIAMHDIDRTQLEYSHEAGPFQHEEFEFNEFESGMMHEELSEHEEIQLAHELLSVTNEQELEQFLGSFLKRAVSTVGQIARSPIGQAIGGVLKGVAKRALPMAGAALGGYVGGPLGAKIGTGLANAAGKAIGLEQESFGENEEMEFAGARQFVRLAADTARQAAAAVASGADPRAAAQSAAVAAARKFAPGLVGGLGAGAAMGGAMGAPVAGQRPMSGRWLRRGRRIVLFGV
jgi:hypothetical protein